MKAEEMLTLADADEKSAAKHAAAKKLEAEAVTATEAAPGLAEADVISAKADALQKQGSTEANVLELKFSAEAKGINEKADAMKNFDGVGREHEEFKLNLNKDKEIELAEINVQKDVAAYQADVLSKALESARIDIVGGESQFFDKLVNSITTGKSADRMIENSEVLSDVKETFFNGDPEYFQGQFKKWIKQFGIKSDDVRNLSIAGVLGKMITAAEGSDVKGTLERALKVAEDTGLADKPAKPFVN